MIASDLSTSALTLRAALVAGSAVVFVVLIGRWKPARRRWWLARGKRPPVALMEVQRTPVPLYRAPRWWERFAALTGLTAIAAIFGAAIAILIAGGFAYAITTLTGLLK